MRIFFLSLIFVFFLTASGRAHPPDDVQLQYDNASDMLHISMGHVSRDLNDHYIRRIVIMVNGEKTDTVINNAKQRDPKEVIYDVSVDAEPTDEISIKAYCEEGGTAVASLIVSGDKVEDKPSSSEESTNDKKQGTSYTQPVYDGGY